MRVLALAFLLLSMLFPLSVQAADNAVPVDFQLGFKALADRIPGIVGQPLENEHHGANGDGLQQTSTGLMVWRKADNWTAFTNGSQTWINGPHGVQQRGNDQRFPWEADDRTPAPTQPQPKPLQYVSSEFDAATENAALDMINASRAQNGVVPLQMDEAIRDVARGRARDMGVRNYFAHVNPDGKNAFDLMRAAGISFRTAAENLGMGSGYRSNLECVRANHEAMMAETPPEDGHRVNILNPAYGRVGIGVYRTSDGRTYYATDFAN